MPEGSMWPGAPHAEVPDERPATFQRIDSEMETDYKGKHTKLLVIVPSGSGLKS